MYYGRQNIFYFYQYLQYQYLQYQYIKRSKAYCEPYHSRNI
jgi:hypothetical protein